MTFIIGAELTVTLLSTSYGNKCKNHKQKSSVGYVPQQRISRALNSSTSQKVEDIVSHASHCLLLFLKGEAIKVGLSFPVKLASNQARIASGNSRFGVHLKVATEGETARTYP